MEIIYAPQQGGMLAGSASYPWALKNQGAARKEIHYGETHQLFLDDNDLVTLTNIDGGLGCILFIAPDPSSKATASSFKNLSLDLLSTTTIDPHSLNSRKFGQFCTDNTIDLTSTLGRQLFDENTLPNQKFVIRCEQRTALWILLPRPSNSIESGGGGSLLIEHASSTQSQQRLPDPIGDIHAEFRLPPGTAKAYEVKKGEYIQIIDVEGQQCSDFMAMRSDALDSGIERYIDSTVTRTMVGGAYPGPGLFDKFYDQDIQPLLAVVQDTVGRHDTFALACTARGYEERGFPGHLNCSDNISNAYEPYGINRRQAWPAINFFFNSSIETHDNHLISEEAWSRPGDYVVMQALTDLVCVSTACPDDIDPINGWNPTEIHVRIYNEDSAIPRAIAHRPFVESEANMTMESAFHPRTSQLTQSFSVARDVWLPTSYEATRAIEEYWTCSQSVTIQDMSSLRKYDVMGPDAETLLQLCMTRDVSKLSVNRGTYTLMCSDTGSVIDDGTLFRLAPDIFRWCCGSEESSCQLKEVAQKHNLKVWVKSLWSAMPNIAIQGPKSRELLSKLIFTQPTQPALENIKWFGFTIARLHDQNGPAFMLTRSGFTGELGYEIFCDASAATKIWDAVMEAGEEFGILPMGSEALEMKRIEAGLMISGAEFTSEVDAFEAGLGFAIDLKKEHFIGRDALERNSVAPRKSLAGFIIKGTEIPQHGAPIFVGRRQVGVITSATRSPELNQVIALGRIAIEHSALETGVEIGCLDGHIKRLSAVVCSFPFIDPKRERARA